MGVLSPPRDGRVERALAIARELGKGETIDGAPALRHAVRVVTTLERHVVVAPDQAAGIILHDTPFFEATTDLEALYVRIDREVSEGATGVVKALVSEHDYMDQAAGTSPDLASHLEMLALPANLDLLLATIADKITSFESILGRSERAADRVEFWRVRRSLAERLVYFRQVHIITSPCLPAPMAKEYDVLVTRLEREILSALSGGG